MKKGEESMSIRKPAVLVLALVLVLATLFATGCTTGTTTKVKVGVLYISTVDDGGWSQAHKRGIDAAVAEIGASKVDLMELQNIPDTDTAKTNAAIDQMVAAGCKIIFATSFGYMDAVAAKATQYPDVKFEHCSGYKTAANLDNYFGQIEQPRYLSGIVAGMKSTTGKIGFVAAMPLPEVIRGINAFTLGVLSVNPTAKVYVKWTNTWYGPDVEKEAAVSLLNEGCDVLAQHQDSPAALKAAEEAGMFGIGYDNPMGTQAPKAYLTAPVWNWGAYYAYKIKAVMNGTWKVEQYWGGLKEGIVALDTLSSLVADGTQAKVDAVTTDLKAQGNDYIFKGPLKDQTGTVKVEAGKTMTRDEQMAMSWFVEGVVGEIPAS